MNVLLWIVQAALALLYLTGGSYKVFNFDEIAPQMDALSRSGWSLVGMFEMLGAVLLVVPAAAKWMPVLTPIAAAALAVETFALSALYARYSTKFTVENPLMWSAVMGLLAVLVAYGRYTYTTAA